MLDRALSYLTAADAASLPAAVQAEALRALGRAEAKHTAARARVLGAFAAQGGFSDDGHGHVPCLAGGREPGGHRAGFRPRGRRRARAVLGAASGV